MPVAAVDVDRQPGAERVPGEVDRSDPERAASSDPADLVAGRVACPNVGISPLLDLLPTPRLGLEGEGGCQ
jgi:hypothetical protein